MSGLVRVTQIAVQLGPELQAAQTRGIRQGALAVTTAIRAEIRADTGDMRLSGVGRRGARVGARFDVKGTVNPTAIVTATGPLHLIERSTQPHPITPRGRRVSKRWQNAAAKGKADPSKPIYLAGAKALHFDGRFSMSAQHPGTGAKRPFARGVARSKDRPAIILDQEIQNAIRRVLR